MAGRYSGRDTKDMLADALIAKLEEGKKLSKIPIRELTEACNLDRQTFYYHFKNIYELTEYTYNRALKDIFNVEDRDELLQFDWHYRFEKLLEEIEKNPALRDNIIPILGEGPIRRYVSEAIDEFFQHDMYPQLVEAGQSKKEAQVSTKLFGYSLQAVLIAWITRETDWTPTEILDEIERMQQDYLRGIRMRPENQKRAGASQQ